METTEFPILSTKYKIPAPRKAYILRTELLQKLCELIARKVIIIKAGAGSGKTTLMTVLIREKKLTGVKWITMDESMNQIWVFWSYVFHALKDQITENHEELTSIFEGTVPIELLENMLPLYASHLTLEHDIYLILDDFQSIDDANVFRTMEEFLGGVPDNFHLILLSRTMPGIHTGTLYMEDNLGLINEEDMRLTNDECSRFLVETLGMNKENEYTRKIIGEANGWIGGAQLMAVSGKISQVSRSLYLSADEQVIFDYIEQEIFQTLSEEEQLFLEKTAVLSYFNEQICDKYLPEYQFAHMMQQIMDKNLFVIMMDEETSEYRYHAILREFLMARLSRNVERRNHLFIKAADIMYEYGDYSECVCLLNKAKDYRKLMEMLLKMPQTIEIFGYMMQVPLDKIIENPNFAYQYFFCYYASMDLDHCKQIYSVIQKYLKHDIAFSVFNHADFFLNTNWSLNHGESMSYEEINSLPLNQITKAYLLIKEAYFVFLDDNITDALTYLEKAEHIYEKTGNIYIECLTLLEKTQILEECGELSKTLQYYDQMRTMLKYVPTMKPSYYIGIAGIYIWKMNYMEANTALEQVPYERIKELEAVRNAYLYTLGDYYYICGEYDQTERILLEEANIIPYQSIFFAYRILRYPECRAKNPELRRYFISQYEQTEEHMKNLNIQIIYVYSLYEENEVHKALECLNQILAKARKNKSKLNIIEGALMKARFLYEQNETNHHIENMVKEALSYAMKEQIRLPFWFERAFMRQLLQQEKDGILAGLSQKEWDFICDTLDRGKKSSQANCLSRWINERMRIRNYKRIFLVQN